MGKQRFNLAESTAAFNAAASKLGPEYQHLKDQAQALVNQKYSRSFGDRIANLFGDYSSEDSFYQGNLNQAMEILASAGETDRQQDYDTASAQVARERAAGLNPDLTGTGSDAAGGSADTPPDQIQNSGQPTDNSAVEFVTGIGKLAMSASLPDFLTKCIGLTNSLVDFRRNRMKLDYDEIGLFLDNVDKVTDANVGSGSAPLAGVSDPVNPGDDSEPLDSTTVVADAPDTLDAMAAASLSSAALGRFRNMRKAFGKGTLAYKELLAKRGKNYYNDSSEIADVYSRPGFSDNIQKFALGYSASQGQLERDKMAAEAKRAKAVADYEAKLHSPEMAEVASDAAEAAFARDKATADYQKAVTEGLDAQQAAEAQNKESYARERQAIDNAYAADIARAQKEHAIRLIHNIDNSGLDDATKAEMYQQVIEDYTQFCADLQESYTKAGKVIGQTDVLNAATAALGELLDLIDLKGIAKNIFKGKKKAGKKSGKSSRSSGKSSDGLGYPDPSMFEQ